MTEAEWALVKLLDIEDAVRDLRLLLQQQQAEIERLRAQQAPGDREATAIEALKRLRQWGRISCVGSYSPVPCGYSAEVLVGVLDWIDGGMEGPLPPLPAHALPMPQGEVEA